MTEKTVDADVSKDDARARTGCRRYALRGTLIGCATLLLLMGSCYVYIDWPLWYWADPITAKVVDEETGTPLAGTVVVAEWSIGTWSGGYRPFTYAEAMTNKDGVFHIPGWGPKRAGMFRKFTFHDPDLHFFKSGYRFEERSNFEAYSRPLVTTGTDGKDIELAPANSEGKLVLRRGWWPGARRFSYWNGKVIALTPHRSLEEEARALREPPPFFLMHLPRFWRAWRQAVMRLPPQERALVQPFESEITPID